MVAKALKEEEGCRKYVGGRDEVRVRDLILLFYTRCISVAASVEGKTDRATDVHKLGLREKYFPIIVSVTQFCPKTFLKV